MDHEFIDSMERGFDKAVEVANQTGQKTEDMLFSVGGKPGEESVRSIEELNASGETMPFLCVRTSMPTMVPHSHRMRCDGCGEEVWMSPGTKMTFDKIDKKLIVCIQCVAKLPGMAES